MSRPPTVRHRLWDSQKRRHSSPRGIKMTNKQTTVAQWCDWCRISSGSSPWSMPDATDCCCSLLWLVHTPLEHSGSWFITGCNQHRLYATEGRKPLRTACRCQTRDFMTICADPKDETGRDVTALIVILYLLKQNRNSYRFVYK